MTLEIRIPISPTPSFLTRSLLLTESVRRFYPDTVVRVYIGETGGPTPDAVQRVTKAFTGRKIGWEWIGQREFEAWEGTRSPFLATMNRRFNTKIDGDYVMIADADVLCTAPFPELFEANAVQGVQAHVTPFGEGDWRYLFKVFDAPEPPFDCEFSGNGIMGPADLRGPWYANSGMIFAPRALFEKLCQPYHKAINTMRSAMRDTYWLDQLGVALAVAKAAVPTKSLPLKFNFPNQREFDEAHPDELADVRFIHYLRTSVVDRDVEFQTEETLQGFRERSDLTGSNEILRQNVEQLVNG